MRLGADITQAQNRIARQLALDRNEIILCIRIGIPWRWRRHALLWIEDIVVNYARIGMAGRCAVERRKNDRVRIDVHRAVDPDKRRGKKRRYPAGVAQPIWRLGFVESQ